jgi:hypothetical protein
MRAVTGDPKPMASKAGLGEGTRQDGLSAPASLTGLRNWQNAQSSGRALGPSGVTSNARQVTALPGAASAGSCATANNRGPETIVLESSRLGTHPAAKPINKSARFNMTIASP